MNEGQLSKGLFQRLYVDSFRGLSKEVWILSITLLINRAGSMVLPFVSLFLTQDQGWTKLETGFAVTCYGCGSLAGAFVGGKLADRFRHKDIMFWSLILGGLAIMSIGFFKNFYMVSATLFIAAAISDALRPPLYAEVSLRSTDDNITRGISLVRLAVNLGISVGPAVGGFLAFAYGYFWLFILDGITCILAGLFLYFMLDSAPKKKKVKLQENKKAKSPYTDFYFMCFLFFNLVILTGFFQILFSAPVYLKEVYGVNEKQIGWFFTANGLLIFLFEMPIIYYLEKAKLDFKPLMIGAVMMGAAYLSFAIFQSFWPAIISYSLLIAFGEIINFPFINTISIRRSDEDNLGDYMGAVAMLFSLSLILSPMCGLPVIELVDNYNVYWMIIGSAFILGAIGIAWTRKHLDMELK